MPSFQIHLDIAPRRDANSVERVIKELLPDEIKKRFQEEIKKPQSEINPVLFIDVKDTDYTLKIGDEFIFVRNLGGNLFLPQIQEKSIGQELSIINIQQKNIKIMIQDDLQDVFADNSHYLDLCSGNTIKLFAAKDTDNKLKWFNLN